MGRILGLLGMTIGGWIGWELGALVSIFMGYIVGMVGTGLGLWLAQHYGRRFLP